MYIKGSISNGFVKKEVYIMQISVIFGVWQLFWTLSLSFGMYGSK